MKNERKEQVRALIVRVSKLMAEFNGFVNFYTKREVNSPSNGEILGNCELEAGVQPHVKQFCCVNWKPLAETAPVADAPKEGK